VIYFVQKTDAVIATLFAMSFLYSNDSTKHPQIFTLSYFFEHKIMC